MTKMWESVRKLSLIISILFIMVKSTSVVYIAAKEIFNSIKINDKYNNYRLICD